MKIYNLIWGFSLGAGIDKCYLTYCDLSSVDNSLEIYSACINLTNLNTDFSALKEKDIEIINIKHQLDFSWINKLKISIDKSKPDILFVHGFNGAIISLLIKFLKGVNIPVVCTYHGLYHAPTISKRILEPFYNGLSRYVYKSIAKKIICVENMSRDFLIKKGVSDHKIVTVYNGLMPLKKIKKIDLKKYNISNNELIIITASRITEVKGLPYLLQAIALIKNKSKFPFKYFMIGDGPDLPMLKKMINQLNIDDCVKCIGYQPNISSWLDVADIFALPSLSEYHSIAILEAMRSGTSIVATDVGGNGESLRHMQDGILVPSKDVNKFSNALLELINNKNTRIKYGKSAKKRFEENFTENSMKLNLVKVLKS